MQQPKSTPVFHFHVKKRSLRACSENGFLVAQATRLCRPATRRTERERQFEPMGTTFPYVARGSSGRRVADRGGRVGRATHFQNGLWWWRRGRKGKNITMNQTL